MFRLTEHRGTQGNTGDGSRGTQGTVLCVSLNAFGEVAEYKLQKKRGRFSCVVQAAIQESDDRLQTSDNRFATKDNSFLQSSKIWSF